MYKIINNYNNHAVIFYYLEIIRQSLLKKGEKVEYVNSIDQAGKQDTLIVSHSMEAGLARLKGYKNIIIWEQGVMAEESYMRNKSELRRWIIYKIQKYGFEKAKKVFFVSKSMRDFISNKLTIDFSNNSFIMPCFNTGLNEECFNIKDKYTNNVFTYVGSLSKWQCFEETVDMYKMIEGVIPNTAFIVYTFTPIEAEKVIKEKGIKNYIVGSVSNKELPNKLRDVKYGFILREDNIVNKVATPTKISTYLSCGVIPIFSTILESFFEESKKMNYCIPITNIRNINPIIEFSKRKVNNKEIFCEYKNLFDTYYCTEKYIEEIAKFI